MDVLEQNEHTHGTALLGQRMTRVRPAEVVSRGQQHINRLNLLCLALQPLKECAMFL
jgi:hypothetical protein